MSSAGSLAKGSYTTEAFEMAKRNRDFCIGFIAQNRVLKPDGTEDVDFLYLTPGVGLVAKGDSLGQQYRTPKEVIIDSLCDVIIVGRGIYGSGDAIENAKAYREAGWNAYLERCQKK
jgi:orotidine-5'-phosphate decarboxylase